MYFVVVCHNLTGLSTAGTAGGSPPSAALTGDQAGGVMLRDLCSTGTAVRYWTLVCYNSQAVINIPP